MDEIEDTTELDDPMLLVRSFSAELTPGDGRTVDVRIVKYGERGIAADGNGGQPLGIPYQEEWAPGAFDHQVSAATRLTANVEHEFGVKGIVARGLALRAAPDALYGTFGFLKTPNGDTALELVREGVFDQVSMEAYPAKQRRLRDGAILRTKANLRAIAFCASGAFPSSRVLALRGEARSTAIEMDEELFVPEMDDALLTRVARLGITVPGRMKPAAEALLVRAFSTDKWDGSSSNYKDSAAYCEACLIDKNPAGKPKVAVLCHLPVKEPDGDYNVNAIRDALSRLDEVQGVSAADKASAKSRLDALLAQFNKNPVGNKDADD